MELNFKISDDRAMAEIIISDTEKDDISFTYVHTHESMCGPYFVSKY
jgi:hypothetical protein